MPGLPDMEVFRRYPDSTALNQEVRHVSVDGRKVLQVSESTLRVRQ